MRSRSIIAFLLSFAFCLFARAGGISIAADKTSGCVPLTVNFTNTSTVGVHYRWYNVGTGVDTVTNISHTYTAPGSYPVILYAYDANGQFIGDTSITIDVSGSSGDFFISNSTACPNQEITFSASESIAGYTWLFGDGSTATTSQAHHTYPATGTYDVRLIINTTCGIDTTTKRVMVTDSLFPLFYTYYIIPALSYYSQNKVCPGEMVGFSATTQYPVYDGDLSFHWDFGDGTTLAGNNQSPSHSFSAFGFYPVTLSVYNSCGLSHSFIDTIFVVDTISIPTPSFSVSPVPGCSSTQLKFTFWRNYPSLLWNFGDGTTDTTLTPAHTFPGKGSYIVRLTAMNTCGNSNFYIDTVSVSDTVASLYEPYFQIVVDTLCPGDELLTFDWYTNYNRIGTIMWDFGDGTTDTSVIPSHKYINPGIYPVTKTLTGSCGVSSSYTDTVVVSSSSSPGIPKFDDAQACPGDSIKFVTYVPLIYTYGQTLPYSAFMLIWDFGDGTIDTTYNDHAEHAYSNPGRYDVKVTSINGCGKSSFFTETAYIANNTVPSAYFIWQSGSNNGVNLTCDNISFTAGNTWVHNSISNTYAWDFGDGNTLTTNSSTVDHAFNNAGSYTVSLKATNSCGNQDKSSREITITGVCTGIDPVYPDKGNMVKIFPNPFSYSATIQITDEGPHASYDLFVFDVLGRTVFQRKLYSRQETLILDQPGGIYFYKLAAEGNIIGAGKMIKQ